MFNAKTQLHKIGGGVGSLSCEASTLRRKRKLPHMKNLACPKKNQRPKQTNPANP